MALNCWLIKFANEMDLPNNKFYNAVTFSSISHSNGYKIGVALGPSFFNAALLAYLFRWAARLTILWNPIELNRALKIQKIVFSVLVGIDLLLSFIAIFTQSPVLHCIVLIYIPILNLIFSLALVVVFLLYYRELKREGYADSEVHKRKTMPYILLISVAALYRAIYCIIDVAVQYSDVSCITMKANQIMVVTVY